MEYHIALKINELKLQTSTGITLTKNAKWQAANDYREYYFLWSLKTCKTIYLYV